MDDELERLRKENARLQELLDAKQQVDVPASSTSLLNNHDLVEDLCKFAEGLVPESVIRKKHKLSEDVWNALGDDEEFVQAIELQKLHRIRTGQAKRELAQKYVVKGPDVLEKIMSDQSANDRHRIDAVKAMDAIAEPEAAKADVQHISIRIDLSADSKLNSVEPNPNDIIDINAEVLPMIAK